jgi:RHS repeat-associated protein
VQTADITQGYVLLGWPQFHSMPPGDRFDCREVARTYDGLDDLTDEQTAQGQVSYSYDNANRRTSMTVAGNTFNADNAMTAFNGNALMYDTAGNLTNDGTNTYAWDARNQLGAIAGGVTASFVYGPFGRRMSKTINGTATSFLYDRLNPVQELENGSPSANMLTGLGIDEYFQRSDSNGVSDLLTDALGSTLALADSSGAIQTSYTYEPFGNTTAAGASSSNPFQFTGRENDGTGLYYYRARYYSPGLGRFISEDPLEFNGGGPNLYSYVGDDPIGELDPSGRGIVGCADALANLLRAIYNIQKDLGAIARCGECNAGHERELKGRIIDLKNALAKVQTHCAAYAGAAEAIAEALELLGEAEECLP